MLTFADISPPAARVLRFFYSSTRAVERRFIVLWSRIFRVPHPKNIFNFRVRDFLQAAQSGERIADLGCGSGRIAASLQEAGHYVLGVDAKLQQIHFPVADVVEANILDPKTFELLRERRISAIVLSHVLEHLGDPIGYLRSLSEFGHVMVCVPSRENWRWQTHQALGMDPRLDATHFKEYTLEELDQELAAAGFSRRRLSYNSEGEIFADAYR